MTTAPRQVTVTLEVPERTSDRIPLARTGADLDVLLVVAVALVVLGLLAVRAVTSRSEKAHA